MSGRGGDRERFVKGSGRADVDPVGGALADRALAAVEGDGQLSGGRLGGHDGDLGAWDEPLVVEPVQEVAVVLGEPDDPPVAADLELCERDELGVLGLLELRVDRPAVRAAVRARRDAR